MERTGACHCVNDATLRGQRRSMHGHTLEDEATLEFERWTRLRTVRPQSNAPRCPRCSLSSPKSVPYGVLFGPDLRTPPSVYRSHSRILWHTTVGAQSFQNQTIAYLQSSSPARLCIHLLHDLHAVRRVERLRRDYPTRRQLDAPLREDKGTIVPFMTHPQCQGG